MSRYATPDIDVKLLPDEKCAGCVHFKPTYVFDLCMAKESKYTIEGKSDFHTISHMRLNGCGADANLAVAVLKA